MEPFLTNLISPIRLISNKENWKKSLLIWLVIFFIFGIINSILNVHKYSILVFASQAVLTFFVFGYIRIYLNKAINGEETILPSINFKQITINAFKLSIILLPIILLNAVLILTIIYNSKFLFGSHNFSNIVMDTAIVFFFIIINIFTIFVECAYLKDFKFKEGFRYLKIWKMFKLGWIDIVKTFFLAFWVITPIACIFSFIDFLGQHFSILGEVWRLFKLYTFFYLLFDLIKMNFVSQIYKNVLSKIQESDLKQKINQKTIIILLSLLIISLLSALFLICLHVAATSLINTDFHYITHSFAIKFISETYHISEYLISIGGYLLNYIFNYLLTF